MHYQWAGVKRSTTHAGSGRPSLKFEERCRARCLGWVAVLLAAVRPVNAIDPTLGAAVPADALAVVFIDVDGRISHSPTMMDYAAGAVASARSMGLLSGLGLRSSMVLDAVAAIPILTRQPIALALTDIQAEPTSGGGHKLAALQLSLLLHTAGDDAAVTRVIQQFLNRYTNSTTSRVDGESRGPFMRFRLTDSRLPDWAIIEWGRVGDDYLISLGDGAFDRAAGAVDGGGAALDSDAWFVTAGDTVDIASAGAAWYVNFESLQRALAPGLGGLERRIAEAFALPGVEQSVWAIGVRDRGLRFEYYQRLAGRSQRFRVARPASPADLDAGMIPPQASWYALIAWQPAVAVPGYATAYVQSRDPEAQARLRSYWTQLERSLDVSIERDLIYQLGDRILAHNDPPHPLLPGGFSTLQIEIAGSTSSVRTIVEKLLTHWQRESTGASGGDRPVLERSDDGVWYLQYGLYGPAVAVYDGWLILGASPRAVRHNLARLARRAPIASDAESASTENPVPATKVPPTPRDDPPTP